MADVKTLTFGCRLNAYESEVMRNLAQDAVEEDVLIVNSCAVTAEAVRQTRQAIRKAKRDNPEVKIVVTGCAAQTEAMTFGEMDEVSLVIGNHEKLKAETYQGMDLNLPKSEKVKVNDIMAVRETAGHMIDSLDGRARAFIQVQNGCDHRCTFCIIPYGRGPSRSVPMGSVVEQIKQIADNGIAEVVLTGVDITSYGPDLPGSPSFGKLVQQILRHVPDLPRLRISSIDSIEADDALMDALADPRLMPHLHLSLQSGDNMILKRMKRRHAREDTLAFVEAARRIRPDMVFGADIIAGFPTETDEMFENSRLIVEEADIIHTHIFPYSRREGTPAARIPNQLPNKVKKERAAILRATGDKQFAAHCQSRIGKSERVLIEQSGMGRSEQFLPVMVEQSAGQLSAGDLVNVVIKSVTETGLVGQMAQAAA